MKETDYLYIIVGYTFAIVIFIILCILIVLFIAHLVNKNNKIQKQNQEILKEISIKQDAIIRELQLLRGYTPYNNYQQQYYNNRKNY